MALVAVVILATVLEAAEWLRSGRRRTARAVSRWWEGVDRRSRRRSRGAELALVARRVGRPRAR